MFSLKTISFKNSSYEFPSILAAQICDMINQTMLSDKKLVTEEVGGESESKTETERQRKRENQTREEILPNPAGSQ